METDYTIEKIDTDTNIHVLWLCVHLLRDCFSRAHILVIFVHTANSAK